ncbi:MAG TPA: coagulation factor 5/8 type domain-containing protein [Tepidisphaeraceae bacterium]
MKDIQPRLDAIFAQQERAQFGDGRIAYLFEPGTYHLDVRLGFYMQALGLGTSPDDVHIIGSVRSTAEWMHGNATCNFWRAAENLSITPINADGTDTWAVSQGTALRRIHIHGNLNLWDHGWSSGGFLSDSKIDGQVNSGSQQQWLSRNDQWKQWIGGAYNMVFVGTPNASSGTWPDRPFTQIDRTPIIAEKPYLFVDKNEQYFVMVPAVQKDSRGITWANSQSSGTPVPLAAFYIAHPDKDTADTINAALRADKNLLFTPGIYPLDSPLHITRPNTIMLGLGYPTLCPTHGTPAIITDDVDGSRLAGLLLESGERNSAELLRIGPENSHQSHAENPTVLSDIFCRAGGSHIGKTSTFITINSNHVIGDNFWLWRADHGAGVGWDQNLNDHGLVVNGDDATLYGLFVEHCQGYQTLINGERCRTYFYQSEMPYDPPSNEAWRHNYTRGYASYKVADKVTSHEAYGLGIYCVFYRAPIIADSAIEAPEKPGIQIHHIVTIRFAGQKGSGILHLLNNQGGDTIHHRMARSDN